MKWTIMTAFLCTSLFVICGSTATNAVDMTQTNGVSQQKGVSNLKPTKDVDDLKRKCIKATICAIELDKLRHKADALETDLAKYKQMTPESYQLPEKRELVGWAYPKAGINEQIYCNQSRSGPFYHIAGINGDDYSVIGTNANWNAITNKYHMTIYLVYRRHYPFSDHYVYIDSAMKEDKQ